MVNRFLEKRVEVDFNDNTLKTGNSIELEYYLLECENTELSDTEVQKTYGVGIVKKHHGILNESKQFANIFNSRDQARSLIENLAQHTVTPTSLLYILDDLLGV